MRHIPYSHQWIDSDDIREVAKVLASDWLTQGPAVKKFEDALCKYADVKYAVAVSSGTAALHIACLAAGIRKGDSVITSPMTFAASANCILYCGAAPIFADIDPVTLNIDPRKIEGYLKLKPKAIIPVHFAGVPCDMEAIYALARKSGSIIIEDACHALGAEYKTANGWVKVGSCKHSDMAVFSFHPVKSITTGEGGAILTNCRDFYERLIMFRNHGITKDSKRFITKTDNRKPITGEWYYEMQYLGFNYRMTDIQAALGYSQLKKLKVFVAKRSEIAKRYHRAFRSLKERIRTPYVPAYARSSWHLYIMRINPRKRIEEKRRKIFDYLRKSGIGTQVHYIPVYWHPYYQGLGYKKGMCPVAEEYYKSALSIPLFYSLKDRDIKKAVRILKDAVAKFL